ncbi:MAG: hypothetical protein FWC54_02340 [Actinomycetia bacterium]|nr:hypothetical protein [Actinomycetes bacterium]
MKKYLFVTALAALLVFAIAAVAGAQYAGYATDGSRPTPAGPASKTPGYLSWGGAVTLMEKNGITAANPLSNTAHGGYTTATTKCAVCHSVHRAIGGATAGVISNNYLTSGSGSCVECHTAWGSTQSPLIVEWANDGVGGPHTYPTLGCTECHKGRIHGTGTSAYWGMNAYMLGGLNDTQIAAELPLQAGDANTGGTAAATTEGLAWFSATSGTVNTTVGGIPAGLTEPSYAVARSLLTGFTCGRTGCHVNSVFGNIEWGQTYTREQLGEGTGFMMTTGHRTAPGASSTANVGQGCGPCHPGNAAGGYRYTTDYALASARAYGCDQCHDAVGVATNSTAFPHGNRNIQMYQWDGTGAIGQVPAVSGDLWMYQSNMAQSGTGASVASIMYDPQFTLLYGTEGEGVTLQGVSLGPDGIGNITDGVCLKCHVPYDDQSATALGAVGAAAVSVCNHDRPSPAPTTMPADALSTDYMYLWW